MKSEVHASEDMRWCDAVYTKLGAAGKDVTKVDVCTRPDTFELECRAFLRNGAYACVRVPVGTAASVAVAKLMNALPKEPSDGQED